MYKQKSGAMMRARYNKDAESPFKNQNPPSPNPFRTEEMMNLRENIQSMKKSKLSGYINERRYTTRASGNKERITPTEFLAANVLNSQREKFKSGPSLINKDQTTSLYSPDPIKKSEMEQGMYRLPGRLANRLVAVGNNDQIGNRDVIYGPSGEGFEDQTQKTDPKSGRSKGFTTSQAAKAMSRLDTFFRKGKF